jgi:hypothetical protein
MPPAGELREYQQRTVAPRVWALSMRKPPIIICAR